MARHHAEIYEDPSITGDDPGRGFDEYLGRAERYGTWVAVSDSKILGFAGLLSSREMLEGEIEPVIVTSNARGKGIGTKLLQFVTEEAKKRNIRFLSIRPVARNKGAISLYVKSGFNILGYVDLFKDISADSQRKWKSGITIHSEKLKY
jgi:GNAT superfamily N-acetyltransferase